MKAEKPERPTRYGHAFVMRDAAGDVYLRPRPPTGLLAKMTEVPDLRLDGDRQPTRPSRSPPTGRHRGQIVHVFTHFRLELEVWTATDSSDTQSLSDGWWAEPRRPRRGSAAEPLPKVLKLALR